MSRLIDTSTDAAALKALYVFEDVVIVRVSAKNTYPGYDRLVTPPLASVAPYADFGPYSDSSSNDPLVGAKIRVHPVKMAAPT